MTPGAMLWRYIDARGIAHIGTVRSVYDHGGTDVTHAMESACGMYVMVSGRRLRDARTLNRSALVGDRCDHR